MFAAASGALQLARWIAGQLAGKPAQIVIAGAPAHPGDPMPGGAACVLEAVSPEHVIATFGSDCAGGMVTMFADWSLQEWLAVQRFLPQGQAVSTLVLTAEPELAMGAFRNDGRSCAVFPASLDELQPVVRLFTAFRGLTSMDGMAA